MRWNLTKGLLLSRIHGHGAVDGKVLVWNTHWWSTFAPTTFERSSIDTKASQLHNCQRSTFVCVVFDERTSLFGMKLEINNKTEVLQQWNKIILLSEMGYIAQVHRGLPRWSLSQDNII